MKKAYLLLRSAYDSVGNKIGKNDYLSVGAAFLFFLGLNSLIYFSVTNVSSYDDQWFYFKIAELLRTHGWGTITDFKWLYFTNLAQDHLNYGLTLYHYYLVPFTLLSNKIFGLKLSGVVLASSVPTFVYYVWKKLRFKQPFLWSMGLYIFFNFATVWRMFIDREFVLIDGLILLEILLLHQKKYKTLFVVAALHTWWHTGTFWVVPIMAVVFELVRYINTQKVYLKNIAYGTVGACVGFLFYPPHADQFFSSMSLAGWVQSLSSYFYGINTTTAIREGNEVYKQDFFTLFTANNFIFGALIFVIVLNIIFYIYKKRHGNKDLDGDMDRVVLRESVFIICLAFVFGELVVSNRFQDILLPVLFLGTALAIQFVHEGGYLKIGNAYIKKIFIISLAIFFSYLFVNRALDIRNQIGNGTPYDHYEQATNWLKNNSAKNEIVFNTNWSQAPVLFFYDDWNYYIVGLEPKSLYRYNPDLYWLWHNISYYGIVCNKNMDCGQENRDRMNQYVAGKDDAAINNIMVANAKTIAPIIKEKFESQYVFFDGDTVLRKEMDADKDDYDLAYHDDEGGIYIYKIK